jgi:glutathione synthase/RimK-type ligase-like ATP-grasp enzyme
MYTLEFVLEKAKWYTAKTSLMKYESQNKFGELLEANRLGLKIPKMIYTNDSREAQRFLFENTAILKESGLKFFKNGKSEALFFRSKKINPLDRKLSYIDKAPCMFQEYIEKAFEVRAMVVGNKVLSCKIEILKEGAREDWRGKEHLARFAKFKLPTKIEKKILKFAQDKNFKLASFDFVVDKKGDYYFLEMNRPGQWFFIEALSGLPIAKTLAQSF